MPRNRRTEIVAIAKLLGNAIDHDLIYEDDASGKEVRLYQQQAIRLLTVRTWTQADVTRCRELAMRRARKELEARLDPQQAHLLAELLAKAERGIADFIRTYMHSQFRSYL